MFNPEKGLPPQETGQEGKENFTSEINIYAIEQTITDKVHVTKHGWGHSTPLETPEKRIYYRWEGWLHQTEDERNYPKTREDYVKSSNGDEDLERLAQNFAFNYRQTQNPKMKSQGLASYSLNFNISEDIVEKVKKDYGENAKVRELTIGEHKRFMDAFANANRESTKRRG